MSNNSAWHRTTYLKEGTTLTPITMPKPHHNYVWVITHDGMLWRAVYSQEHKNFEVATLGGTKGWFEPDELRCWAYRSGEGAGWFEPEVGEHEYRFDSDLVDFVPIGTIFTTGYNQPWPLLFIDECHDRWVAQGKTGPFFYSCDAPWTTETKAHA